mgnify:CR=1 FL=1
MKQDAGKFRGKPDAQVGIADISQGDDPLFVLPAQDSAGGGGKFLFGNAAIGAQVQQGGDP